VLWKQTNFLIKIKGLPAELEVLVKDLWTLRLQNLAYRIDDDDNVDNDTQSQMFSSQSEGETDTDGEPILSKGRKKDATPKLLEALALCYLGIVLLRLPYTIGDITEWASKGEMPYYRAIQEVPKAMREQLPGAYHEALEPSTLLKLGVVQRSVAQLVILFKRDFKMSFPRLNRPLLAFQYIQRLALPLDVYLVLPRLAESCAFTLDYPADIAKRLQAIDFPESQLAALVVIATKLLYPFDGVQRSTTTHSEPATMKLDWESWSAAISNATNGDVSTPQSRFEKAIKVEETDIFSMSAQELDDYLDFYESTWMDSDLKGKGKDRDFRQAMYAMFPTGKLTPSTSNHDTGDEVAAGKDALEKQKIATVARSMRPRKTIAKESANLKENIVRPGSFYKRHRKALELEGPERLFHQEVARLTGISLDSLVKAVFSSEILIGRHEERREGTASINQDTKHEDLSIQTRITRDIPQQ
jgi:RNA polymerase I-specific transcription initiation factor RRN7